MRAIWLVLLMMCGSGCASTSPPSPGLAGGPIGVRLHLVNVEGDRLILNVDVSNRGNNDYFVAVAPRRASGEQSPWVYCAQPGNLLVFQGLINRPVLPVSAVGSIVVRLRPGQMVAYGIELRHPLEEVAAAPLFDKMAATRPATPMGQIDCSRVVFTQGYWRATDLPLQTLERFDPASDAGPAYLKEMPYEKYIIPNIPADPGLWPTSLMDYVVANLIKRQQKVNAASVTVELEELTYAEARLEKPVSVRRKS